MRENDQQDWYDMVWSHLNANIHYEKLLHCITEDAHLRHAFCEPKHEKSGGHKPKKVLHSVITDMKRSKQVQVVLLQQLKPQPKSHCDWNPGVLLRRSALECV